MQSENQTAPLVRRLLAVGHHLVADGVLPHEAESKIYHSLTSDAPRANLFRTMMGIAEPLTRDSASAISEGIGRELRGQPDMAFVGAFTAAFHRAREMRDACPMRCCQEGSLV